MGWVKTASIDPARSVKACYQRLEVSRFAGSATSINDVLPHLAEAGLCFTVGRSGLEGFITPSDLDRHAARCHFCLLVAGVEMLLSAMIRKLVPEEELVAAISTHPVRVSPDGGPETLRSSYEAARAEGRDTHAVEYLYLGELSQLLISAMGDKMPANLEKQLVMVRNLRPTVMHPTRVCLRKGPVSWQQWPLPR